MLSPSLVSLLHAAGTIELDDAAIAVALRCWMFIGDDTPFKRIRVLPAGGKLTWTPGEPVKVEGQFIFGKRASISRDDAIDEYISLFRTAVARRPASGTSIVPLSGGRDSRHIFLELCASGMAPDVAVTVGGWKQQTSDGQLAAALAERAGVRHVAISLPESRWRAQTSTIPATHLCTFEHWWLVDFISYLEQFKGQASIYEGAAGDVLSTAIFKSEAKRRLYDDGKFRELAASLLGNEKYFRQVLPPVWYERFGRDSAVDRLITELQQHADAPNPLASFYVYNRTRRVTALPPTTLFSPHAKVWCPYLDADVWDFLSSLGPELLESSEIFSFHDDAIHRAYPKFADIPFSAKWGAKPRRRSYDLRTVAEMAISVARMRGIPLRDAYIWPRLIRGLVDPSFTANASDLTSLVSYLAELAAFGRL